MDVVLGLLLALLVGILVGIGGAVAVYCRRARPAGPADPRTASVGLAPEVVEVLQALPSMSVVLDVSDRVVRASPRTDALGLVRGAELAHTEILELVRAVRRDGSTRENELQVARGPLGTGTLALRTQVATLGADHVLALIEDLTYSRRVEETRRDFVVNVSHELKTPVGGLSLLAEAVEGAADDPDAVRRFAGRMHGETARLSRLVQEIVELSRLQVATTLDEPVPVDVGNAARDAVRHLRLLADSRDIDLVQVCATPEQVQVYGDPTLLTTAIRNLLENAIHYSGNGTRVVIAVRRQSDLVSVSVTDQGSGISAADQARIFERFYRVDPARSRRTGGTGLGLAIVKHVAANHGGEVTVWSEEGQGSTFTMTLPAAARTGPTTSLTATSPITADVAGTDPVAPDRPSAARTPVTGKATP